MKDNLFLTVKSRLCFSDAVDLPCCISWTVKCEDGSNVSAQWHTEACLTAPIRAFFCTTWQTRTTCRFSKLDWFISCWRIKTLAQGNHKYDMNTWTREHEITCKTASLDWKLNLPIWFSSSSWTANGRLVGTNLWSRRVQNKKNLFWRNIDFTYTSAKEK